MALQIRNCMYFFIVIPCVLIETTFTQYIDRRDSDDRVILYARNNNNNIVCTEK